MAAATPRFERQIDPPQSKSLSSIATGKLTRKFATTCTWGVLPS